MKIISNRNVDSILDPLYHDVRRRTNNIYWYLVNDLIFKRVNIITINLNYNNL